MILLLNDKPVHSKSIIPFKLVYTEKGVAQMKNNRKQFTIEPLINNETSSASIFCSPSDMGVRRNFGRNGAQFAPKAIMAQLKKMTNRSSQTGIDVINVSDQKWERENFNDAQKKSIQLINEKLEPKKKTIHLGGGHDHIYCLLKAYESFFSEIIVLNIDAHCDTRVDSSAHSGTPFRQFANETKSQFSLFQYGINDFANTDQTLSQLNNGQMTTLTMNEVKVLSQNFQIPNLSFLPHKENALYVFSLDCDAISCQTMEAVSAVNPNGIPFEHVCDLLKEFSRTFSQKALGIYEYNPLFDNLSAKGAKSIAYLVDQYLR